MNKNNLKVSRKLLNSINERVGEHYSGRLKIPTDIKKRIMKETICYDDQKIIGFIQDIYNAIYYDEFIIDDALQKGDEK